MKTIINHPLSHLLYSLNVGKLMVFYGTYLYVYVLFLFSNNGNTVFRQSLLCKEQKKHYFAIFVHFLLARQNRKLQWNKLGLLST